MKRTMKSNAKHSVKRSALALALACVLGATGLLAAGCAPAATASASIFAQAVAAEATVNVFEVVNDSCKVRVIGSVPKLTDDNKIKIVVTANIGGWDLMFDNVRPDQPLDVVIDLKNPDALESMESLSNFMIWGDAFSCENAYIQGGVYYNGIAYGATVNFATRANDIFLIKPWRGLKRRARDR